MRRVDLCAVAPPSGKVGVGFHAGTMAKAFNEIFLTDISSDVSSRCPKACSRCQPLVLKKVGQDWQLKLPWGEVAEGNGT